MLRIALITLLLVLVACGGGEEADTSTPEPTATFTPEPTATFVPYPVTTGRWRADIIITDSGNDLTMTLTFIVTEDGLSLERASLIVINCMGISGSSLENDGVIMDKMVSLAAYNACDTSPASPPITFQIEFTSEDSAIVTTDLDSFGSEWIASVSTE